MKNVLAMLVSLSFLAGCSKDEEKTEALKESKYNGTWVSDGCESIGNNTYAKRTFVMADKKWKIDFTAYGDNACTTALFTFDIAGDWEVRGASDKVAGADKAFFGFTTRTITLKSDQIAAGFNAGSTCGKTDWQANKAVDIHTAGCEALGAKPVASCKGEYDLVKIDGTKWYLGDRSGDLCKEDVYPEKLQTTALVKKN